MDKISKNTHLIAAELSKQYGSNSQLQAMNELAKYKKTGNLPEQQKWMKIAAILSEQSFSKDAFGLLH